VNGVSAPPFLTLPTTVRRAQVVTPRGEFAVLEAGSAGPTVLLVPGWTGSKEDFLALLAPLAEAGYHAVSLDQRGQYETPGSTLESDYSLTDLAGDLLSVATETAPASVHLVGHSFGGLVTRTAAMADPDAVASLTLLDSGPAAQPVERHDLLRAMANAIPAIGLEATWQAKRAYERSQGAPEPPPEIELFMQQRFLANHPTSLRAMTLHLTTARDQVDELKATGVPVMVSFGVADDGWPVAEQRQMAARLGAPVRVIEGAGHSPAAEQPARTLAALEQFWAEVEPDRRRIWA
jgi:pimeloyl-ACP methyl ester carboxylesterase